MSKPIKIEYLAEVAAYLRDVKKVELSTDDVAEALVATSQSGQDLERKLSRAMRDAAKDVEVLEKAVEQIPDATDDAARAADHDFERIGDSAREAGSEAADEFKQNLGSGLAAGGSPEEIITESLGGLIGSLKGKLAVAATLVAGVGLLAYNQIKAEAERTKKSIEELAAVVEGLYTQGVITATKTQQLQEASKWIQDNTEYLRGYQDEADLAGVSMEEFAAAAALGGKPLADLRTRLEEVARTAKTPAEKLAASDLIGYLDKVETETGNVGAKMDLVAGATGIIASNLGLADRNMDGVVDDADQLYVNLDKAVDEAIKVGTGNTDLDRLLEKADKLGWSALTAKEKADLIGSDNTALAKLQSAAAAVEQDTADTKTNLENLADPGMPQTVADAEKVSGLLKSIPKTIETKVAYTAAPAPIGGSYTAGYTVPGGSSTYGATNRAP